MKRTWWKEGIVYQIYPRSFMDSNGDGIGDIQGIISRLDYIKGLGTDIIWLCPVYKSPNDDNGYDISDYQDIMDEFGTMKDWEELLEAVHNRGMKLIMDLVVNHTSDEHQWFIESKKSKDNPYRDYYIWKDGKNGTPPNNWNSVFGGSAWEYDKNTGQYYLHLFSKKQPDLNWQNETVRDEIFGMMRWWLVRGIDGFRMDVINFIAKDQDFPNAKADQGFGNFHDYSVNQPKLFDYLNEMNQKVLSQYDCMTVGECAHTGVRETLELAGEAAGRLNMVFTFDHMFMDMDGTRFKHKEWSICDFKNIFINWHEGLHGKAWNSIFLGNHDFPRMVSRFGSDREYWKESAKMLGTFLLTMPGTVYLYQGDEIGMTNTRYSSIDDYRDIEIRNFIRDSVDPNLSEEEKIDIIADKNRDNARSPFQWDSSVNTGFSNGTPWIKVNSNYTRINAADQENDPDSILNFYREMIRFRKENPVFTYGNFTVQDRDNEKLFLYSRELDGRKYFVILNFSADEVLLPEGIVDLTGKEAVLSNYKNTGIQKIHPYEASIYQL